MRLPVFAALAGALFLTGCQQDVRRAPVLTPIAFQANPDTGRAFFLGGLEFNIRRGQDIGGFQGNLHRCVANASRISWEWGRTTSNAEWSDRFYDVFSELRYPVVGNHANMLERDRERSRAEYVVVAQVTGVEVAVCANPVFGYEGKCYMAVRWQVMSNADRRVVFEGTSEGSVDVETASRSLTHLFLAGFEAATRNLAADSNFHQIVSGERAAARAQQAAAQSASRAAIALNGPTISRASIQDRMGLVRAAVPTIDMGNTHGSGVFITEDGYLLTNDHVVKDRRQVTVRLQGGVEVLGDVIRSDEVRDIALVKVPVNRNPAVPIRATAPQVGDEVYAVGTPLERRLGQSVTRGIVSALRNDAIRGSDRSQPMIQSDVVIQGGNSGGGLFDRNGNLIGIAVSGFGVGNFNAGTNFFIPIESALETLKIELSSQPRIPTPTR